VFIVLLLPHVVLLSKEGGREHISSVLRVHDTPVFRWFAVLLADMIPHVTGQPQIRSSTADLDGGLLEKWQKELAKAK
jgi:hypothetical protein